MNGIRKGSVGQPDGCSWLRIPLTGNQSRLAIVEHPSTNAECRVKNRKRPHRMRKNAGYHKGHEHCRNEHHPIEHGSRAELSSAGTAAEYVEPSNDGYRHTKHTEERTLVSDEWRIHEDRLHRSRAKQ